MADFQTKVLCVKKLGWKRIAHNVERFGWTLGEAEEETETTITTSYEGRVSGDNIYIEEKVSKSTKVRVWLSFHRYKSDFSNYYAVKPLEIIYNIAFLLRRILGFLLPIASVLLLITCLM